MERDDVKRTNIEKRADAWRLLQHAASANERPVPSRSYDRRYQQADITRERAVSEASRASALASQYVCGAAADELAAGRRRSSEAIEKRP